ncbi:hypothetical protein EG329_009212 [Mollisiaceae sp. DMI_Dod_QoI]|nr:hypothetical protein EG329_009212 [Helotiales sp. DMI_Dod_QoI]
MADSMCGPSNALQNFQKHSTVDRTLQQDRLISRQSPSHGFRSTPGPNAGLLDHEFESFQAGQSPLDHNFQPNTFHYAPPTIQQPGPANWATDFQRMNISGPAPELQQQPFGMQAQQRLDTGGWHQDFARQQNQMSERSMQLPSHTSTAFRHSPMPMMGLGSQFPGVSTPQSELSIAQQKQPEESFNEEAFARAFEEAAQAEMEPVQETAPQDNVGTDQVILLDESAEVLMASDDLEMTSDELLSQERIGADTIHDPFSQHQDLPEHNDPEELVRTAAKLLDSVQHDQSSKFQNSQFLSLMRQFRDREMTVEGDQVVAANGMSEAMNQAMPDDDFQEQIALFCRALKCLAFDQQRPFKPTPENMRKLVHILLKIEFLTRVFVLASESTKREPLGCIKKVGRLKAAMGLSEPMLALLRSPWITDLPSTRTLALFGLASCDMKVFVQNNFPFEYHKGLGMELDMDSILMATHTGMQDFSEASTEDILETYISSLLSRDAQTRENALLDVLPYKIRDKNDKSVLDAHFDRAKEILGPIYRNVQKICSFHCIWSPSLPRSDLVQFMGLVEKTGPTSEEAFSEAARLFRKRVQRNVDGIEMRRDMGGTVSKRDEYTVQEFYNPHSRIIAECDEGARKIREARAAGASDVEIIDLDTASRKKARELREKLFQEEWHNLPGVGTEGERYFQDPESTPKLGGDRIVAQTIQAIKERRVEKPQEMRDMAEESVGRVKTRERIAIERIRTYGAHCSFKQEVSQKIV